MKYALVTGGSRGLGRAVCMKLSQMGITVLVNYNSNRQAAEEVKDAILSSGGSAELMGFDVGDERQVSEAIGAWEQSHPDDYIAYLLERFESTFFPKEVSNAGRAAYVKRNQVMIDLCDLAVIYYDENVSPANSHSGTARAVQYLLKRKKRFINIKSQTI